MTKANDISFKYENIKGKFNFRVAAFIQNGEKFLLQKSDKDSFYGLIGGRVSFGETTFEAIKREIYEETGVTLNDKNINLFKIIENFFVYDNKRFHELLFVYKIENNDLNKLDNFKTLDKINCINKWFSKNEIFASQVRPKELKDWLNDEKPFEHLIIVD